MIKENRIVSTCGIMALIPDEDDSDVVVEYYNRVLNNYGGNLRAVCQNYPIVNIFYDEKLDSYYAVSEEVDDKDPLLKWNNLFHYKFFLPLTVEDTYLVEFHFFHYNILIYHYCLLI